MCGSCKVLVTWHLQDHYGSCEAYCAAVDRTCVGAWEEDDYDCVQEETHNCTTDWKALRLDNGICECGGIPGKARLNQCFPY